LASRQCQRLESGCNHSFLSFLIKELYFPPYLCDIVQSTYV
jgi:hypothetical protein